MSPEVKTHTIQVNTETIVRVKMIQAKWQGQSKDGKPVTYSQVVEAAMIDLEKKESKKK